MNGGECGINPESGAVMNEVEFCWGASIAHDRRLYFSGIYHVYCQQTSLLKGLRTLFLGLDIEKDSAGPRHPQLP